MIYIGVVMVVLVHPDYWHSEQPEDKSSIAADESRNSTTIIEDAGKDGFIVRCPKCLWHGMYEDKTRALKALGAHNRKCKKKNMRVSPFAYPLRTNK